jgi:Tetratricopeptide repeat
VPVRTTGRFDEAEPLYRQCIATLAQALGEDYAITARAQRNLAILLLLTKRPKEALPLSEMAFHSHARSGGDSGWLSDSARTYAQALVAVGRKDEAAEILAKYQLEHRIKPLMQHFPRSGA